MKDKDSGTESFGRQGHQGWNWRLCSELERAADPNKVINMYGFEMEKIKAKICKFY